MVIERNLDYLRQKGVAQAWKREREQVLQSRGSRNWNQSEQRQIIATGRCAGIEGQHMMSVHKHPDQADNPNNIQFLTHEEHLLAHGGDYKNDANGRFNRKTGKVDKFTTNDPGSPMYCKLSDPLNDRQKKLAEAKYNRTQVLHREKVKDIQSLKVSVDKESPRRIKSLDYKKEIFQKKANGRSVKGEKDYRKERSMGLIRC